MKREFVMLAHKFDPEITKQHIGGWWYSEKLDGERCFWDGGVSRNLPKADVPYANCAKDARYEKPQIATGLWSRYGAVIHAPDWFLDALPAVPLDGELFALNQQKRQFTHSTIKKIIPVDSEWREITYMVFDSPPPNTIFRDGIIDTTNFKKIFKNCDTWWWSHAHSAGIRWFAKTDTPFLTTYAMLKQYLMHAPDIVRLHNQFELPFSMPLGLKILEQRMSQVLDWGGEGLMIRNPQKCYECGRVHHLLKIKPFDDMEGTVIGYITGRETALGSKLLGMMGALILRLDDGVRLELSGFTDSERTLEDVQKLHSAHAWAVENPETECPDWVHAPAFPRGSRVTFKYRGKSAEGVPQEARYWRKHD